MIVMVDIDNILNDLTKKTIDLYNIRSGKNIKLSDITTYSFFECLPNDAERICKLFKEKELWDSLEPIEGSQEVLKDIVDMEVEVYLATATDPVNFEWKCEWVKKHYPFISTDNIIRIKNKSLLKCDVIVDDCLDNLVNSDAEKVCLDYPWNQSAKVDIHRTCSWIDILNIIERKNKEMNEPITLYTLSECGRCPIIRMMLDTHNVMYTEIMDDRKLMDSKNIENAPAIEVGDRIIDDYHDVLRWLIDNDYYGM